MIQNPYHFVSSLAYILEKSLSTSDWYCIGGECYVVLGGACPERAGGNVCVCVCVSGDIKTNVVSWKADAVIKSTGWYFTKMGKHSHNHNHARQVSRAINQMMVAQLRASSLMELKMEGTFDVCGPPPCCFAFPMQNIPTIHAQGLTVTVPGMTDDDVIRLRDTVHETIRRHAYPPCPFALLGCCCTMMIVRFHTASMWAGEHDLHSFYTSTFS